MRLVMEAYKYKLYNNKKNKYLVQQIEIASEIWNTTKETSMQLSIYVVWDWPKWATLRKNTHTDGAPFRYREA